MATSVNAKNIVDIMETQWGGGFHFGFSQEIDNIHNKTFPFLVVTPPTSTFNGFRVNNSYWETSTQWTVSVYNNLPSAYKVTDDKQILLLWESMENTLLGWFENIIASSSNTFGENVMFDNTTIQIQRISNASNDRTLSIKSTFSLRYFRNCY